MRLSLETSGQWLSLALDDGHRLRGRRDEHIGRGHAERLIPAVAELLGEAGLERADEIAVCVGPGSFTGIRVGFAAAHGLALAWGVSIFGFTATSLIASYAAAEEEAPDRVLTVRDAARGELFVQPFALNPIRALGEIETTAPDEARRRARALGAWSGDVSDASDDGLWSLPCSIMAADVRLLPDSLRKLQPVPLYIRAPDAKPA